MRWNVYLPSATVFTILGGGGVEVEVFSAWTHPYIASSSSIISMMVNVHSTGKFSCTIKASYPNRSAVAKWIVKTEYIKCAQNDQPGSSWYLMIEITKPPMSTIQLKLYMIRSSLGSSVRFPMRRFRRKAVGKSPLACLLVDHIINSKYTLTQANAISSGANIFMFATFHQQIYLRI